jgi:hypothetical protein
MRLRIQGGGGRRRRGYLPAAKLPGGASSTDDNAGDFSRRATRARRGYRTPSNADQVVSQTSARVRSTSRTTDSSATDATSSYVYQRRSSDSSLMAGTAPGGATTAYCTSKCQAHGV